MYYHQNKIELNIVFYFVVVNNVLQNFPLV